MRRIRAKRVRDRCSAQMPSSSDRRRSDRARPLPGALRCSRQSDWSCSSRSVAGRFAKGHFSARNGTNACKKKKGNGSTSLSRFCEPEKVTEIGAILCGVWIRGLERGLSPGIFVFLFGVDGMRGFLFGVDVGNHFFATNSLERTDYSPGTSVMATILRLSRPKSFPLSVR